MSFIAHINRFKQRFGDLTSSQLIVISFLSMIFIGSLILSIPIFHLESSQAKYLDHLFVAASAVSTAGLSTLPLVETYNSLGQLVVLILMQIGCLGFLAVFGLVVILFGRNMNYRQKQAITDVVNHNEVGTAQEFITKIVRFTFIVETIGAFFLSIRLIPEDGFLKGSFNAIFLSVSAFSNSGFDTLGTNSLISYQGDILVNLTVSFLVFLGGLGFAVWFDFIESIKRFLDPKKKRNLQTLYKKFYPHTKLVLISWTLMTIFGMLGFIFIEWNNPETIGNLPLWNKLLTSFFHSVTIRTAGFTTIDFTSIRPAMILVLSYLMIIGGSPGSTAGGLKNTTFAILMMSAWQFAQGKKQIVFDNHTISERTVRNVFIVTVAFVSTFFIGLTVLQFLSPDIALGPIVAETATTLSTSGVSFHTTSELSSYSHIFQMVLMFIGRIGPLTLVLSINNDTPKNKRIDIRYAETDIFVG